MQRRNELTDSEARERIRDGEEMQIVVRWRHWMNAGQLGEKLVGGELRLRTESGERWTTEPAFIFLVHPDEGVEDAGAIVSTIGKWLEVGRTVETDAEAVAD